MTDEPHAKGPLEQGEPKVPEQSTSSMPSPPPTPKDKMLQEAKAGPEPNGGFALDPKELSEDELAAYLELIRRSNRTRKWTIPKANEPVGNQLQQPLPGTSMGEIQAAPGAAKLGDCDRWPIFRLARLHMEQGAEVLVKAHNSDLSEGQIELLIAGHGHILKELRLLKSAAQPGHADFLITAGSQKTAVNGEFFNNRRFFMTANKFDLTRAQAEAEIWHLSNEVDRLRSAAKQAQTASYKAAKKSKKSQYNVNPYNARKGNNNPGMPNGANAPAQGNSGFGNFSGPAAAAGFNAPSNAFNAGQNNGSNGQNANAFNGATVQSPNGFNGATVHSAGGFNGANGQNATGLNPSGSFGNGFGTGTGIGLGLQVGNVGGAMPAGQQQTRGGSQGQDPLSALINTLSGQPAPQQLGRRLMAPSNQWLNSN